MGGGGGGGGVKVKLCLLNKASSFLILLVSYIISYFIHSVAKIKVIQIDVVVAELDKLSSSRTPTYSAIHLVAFFLMLFTNKKNKTKQKLSFAATILKVGLK